MRNPAKRLRREVIRAAHFYLIVDAMRRPMKVRERKGRYREQGEP